MSSLEARRGLGSSPQAAPQDEEFPPATARLRELLLSKPAAGVTAAEAAAMNFAQLRDALLAVAPLDKGHVVEVNRAEAEFWRRAQGYRVDWSDKILGFECGGQQWVSAGRQVASALHTP